MTETRFFDHPRLLIRIAFFQSALALVTALVIQSNPIRNALYVCVFAFLTLTFELSIRLFEKDDVGRQSYRGIIAIVMLMPSAIYTLILSFLTMMWILQAIESLYD